MLILKTFASFKEREAEVSDRVNRSWEFVGQRVAECVQDPEKHRKDPLTYLYARLYYHSQPIHHCYWNDRFVAAVMCDMPLENIRTAAWCVVCNGANSYFEWITHGGHDMRKVFAYLGIDTSHAYASVLNPKSYVKLDQEILKTLIEMFNLPTTYLDVKSTLDSDEFALRKEFNRMYPYDSCL